MLELYTACTSFLDTSHWSVALLVHLGVIALSVPLAKPMTKTLFEGHWSYLVFLGLFLLLMVPAIYTVSMFSSWATFRIWSPDSWSWFYVTMTLLWAIMQLSIWAVIRSGHFGNKDAS